VYLIGADILKCVIKLIAKPHTCR